MLILKDPELLERCSHDETPMLPRTNPIGVIQPASTQEVLGAVQYAKQNSLNIVARGAGTGKAGGCVPDSNSLVIDFSKMNQILEISKENLTARLQPGVILGDFRERLEELNLFYPPDPNSYAWCTIGGNIGTNAAGPSALKYGCTRDYILGLEVVTANGDLMRLGKQTVKGVVGYDLVSLICGSEGTLALVAEATVKLLPKPRNLQTLLMRFQTDEQALQGVNQILSLGYLPRTLEFMDSACTLGHAALIVEFEEEFDAANLKYLDGVVETCVATDEKQRRHIWDQRRLMSETLKKRAKFKISEDIVIPRNQILNFTRQLKNLGEKHGVKTASFGHAGDGNLHAQILFDEAPKTQKLHNILHELFEITIGLNGTISGEHGIGLAKKPYLLLEQSESVIELQKAIKKVFDPNQILNPGKIF